MKILKYLLNLALIPLSYFIKWYSLSRVLDDSIVTFSNFNESILVIDCINTSHCICSKLPDKIIIEPKSYVWFGRIYDCSKPGIYRFSIPQKETRQHLVLDSDNFLLSTLNFSCLFIRGNMDDGISFIKLENLVIKRFTSLTCGSLVSFAMNILSDYGIKCRKVFARTLQDKNSYNIGHVMLEIWHESYQKYVVVDMDKKICFTDCNGIYLSFFELTERIFQNRPWHIISNRFDKAIDLVNFKEKITNFNYGFIEHYLYNSSDGVKNFIERLCQVPLMQYGDKILACSWDINHQNLIKYRYPEFVVTEKAEFYSKFYT